jgi:hypothetical protein
VRAAAQSAEEGGGSELIIRGRQQPRINDPTPAAGRAVDRKEAAWSFARHGDRATMGGDLLLVVDLIVGWSSFFPASQTQRERIRILGFSHDGRLTHCLLAG